VKPEFLYLHVPFCARRCSYCDFAVTATRSPDVAGWIESIAAEAGLVAAAEGWEAPARLRTLYVGGGTPSLLGAGALADLTGRLAARFAWDPATIEWTAEANPESFDGDLAEDWRRTGVNRVSLGAQTFHAPALHWMGRLHGPAGPARAIAAARAAGLRNISIDLIFGLPRHLGREWARDLDLALALEPEHVSLYGLTAETGTPLGRWVAAGRERLADEDGYAAEFLLAAERLTAAGYRHYEVSNFARPGFESRHNAAYWSGDDYLGLGPSAHSLRKPVRRWNLREWPAYREAVMAGRLPVQEREEIGASLARLERYWLGLRTDDGLPDEGWAPAQERALGAWEEAGWATRAARRLRLTAAGWLLLDRLVVDLDAAAA
jgi:oxygen-independent coproporphyrinogen III oxidase